MEALRKHSILRLLPLVLVPAVALLGGCEKDEGPTSPFTEISDVTLAYVGYTDTAARMPKCVRCHADRTFEWRQTAHSGALTTLYESGGAQSFCLKCHTTGWDTSDDIVGADDAWTAATADTLKYRDVQCESCHGPASQHGTFGPDVTDVLKPGDQKLWEADRCGTCHQGTHHPYLSEWQSSKHAESASALGGFVATNPACSSCHVAQAFHEWVDEGEEGFVSSTPVSITCQACHSPHSDENPGQLRLPLGENVICGKCHNAEGTQPGSTVHHATWEVFTGTLAFDYGLTLTNSAHTTALGDEACITCHVVRSPYVSESQPAKTGHTFEPDVGACQQCHVGATDFDIYGVQTATQALIDQLQAKIDAAGPNDQATTAYANALYILQAANTEGSKGIHNTDYIQALLQQAISDFNPTGT